MSKLHTKCSIILSLKTVYPTLHCIAIQLAYSYSYCIELHIGLPSLWKGKSGCEPDVEAAREAALPDFEAMHS